MTGHRFLFQGRGDGPDQFTSVGHPQNEKESGDKLPHFMDSDDVSIR